MNSTNVSTDAILSLAGELEILQRMPRTGFVMSGVEGPQTIAAHSFAVALWCLFLLERLPKRTRVDQAKMLRMAVLHEIAEARIGDIPAPARRYLGDSTISRAERAAVDEMLVSFPDSWRACWHEFEDGSTIEARIVRAADKIELMHRVLMYEQQHNGSLEKFWHWDWNFQDAGLAEARVLFAAMKQKRPLSTARPQARRQAPPRSRQCQAGSSPGRDRRLRHSRS